MSIDWFTFTAQILNFLILVWLLKRFLYGPIVSAMEQREARIAARLTDARAAQDEAAALQNEYHTRLEDLANTREEILTAAGKEVDSWRESHLKTARSDVEMAREQWQKSLLREKDALLRQLQLDVTQHATDLSRHLMQQLADERLQSRLVERFVSLLKGDKAKSRELRESIVAERSVLVESSHELNPQERDRICAAIGEMAPSVTEPDFRVNSRLVCGIELRTAGCRLAWSIRDSLAELESKLIHSIDNVMPTSPRNQMAQKKELAAS